jgi:hypothetical protein
MSENTLLIESDTIKIVSALTNKSERDVLFMFNDVAFELYERLKRKKDQKTASKTIKILDASFNIKAYKMLEYEYSYGYVNNGRSGIQCWVKSIDNTRKDYDMDQLLNELIELKLLNGDL